MDLPTPDFTMSVYDDTFRFWWNERIMMVDRHNYFRRLGEEMTMIFRFDPANWNFYSGNNIQIYININNDFWWNQFGHLVKEHYQLWLDRNLEKALLNKESI